MRRYTDRQRRKERESGKQGRKWHHKGGKDEQNGSKEERKHRGKERKKKRKEVPIVGCMGGLRIPFSGGKDSWSLEWGPGWRENRRGRAEDVLIERIKIHLSTAHPSLTLSLSFTSFCQITERTNERKNPGPSLWFISFQFISSQLRCEFYLLSRSHFSLFLCTPTPLSISFQAPSDSGRPAILLLFAEGSGKGGMQ